MAAVRLLLATGNAGKARELAAALGGLGLELLAFRDIPVGELPAEDGTTYEENALIKARHAATTSGLPALADDSGLEVAALGGGPGIHSARFGNQDSDEGRIAHMLERLRGVPAGQRQAAFHCSLVLCLPDGRWHSFSGRCDGVILEEPAGRGGHGYDPIFYSLDLGETFAQASEARKNEVSHRGRALADFRSWLGSPASLLKD